MESCMTTKKVREPKEDIKLTPSLRECAFRLWYHRIMTLMFSHRGINRLTNNIELALPIIDHAFRFVWLVGPVERLSSFHQDNGC